ncbi:hypothetical protein NA57DRAFT_57908 [Rhizodiscina lignyota]|uniref:intramembrane prenyl-peptidase Rce1 n=1 Tax=Rhizodiscina lignyota TaxID=1504668 RepID=A0A9P4M7G4_9PEZI|nr:hypothetical protein NA57DRAFT_57908 [Rhizodiscina lignyota]
MPPFPVLERLQRLYRQKEVPTGPAISFQTACILSIVFNVLYVAPIYLSPTARPSPVAKRDAPSVIRARIRAITISCVISTLVTYYVVAVYGKNDFKATIALLGWYPIHLTDVARVLLLVAILFAGPLFETGIVEGGWRGWIKGEGAIEVLSSWTGWRNFVAGPITEELIWRSLLIPLHLLASSMYPMNLLPSTFTAMHSESRGQSNIPSSASPLAIRDTRNAILITPLYFGIAHVHHFYEFVLSHPHASITQALIRSLVQFTYTTIFGWFEAYVFVRTGSLLAVIAAHSFCNWLGLPRFWGRLGRETYVSDGRAAVDETLKQSRQLRSTTRAAAKTTTAAPRDDDDDDEDEDSEDVFAPTQDEDPIPVLHAPRGRKVWTVGIGWTIAYYLLLVAGAVGFWKQLGPLTESTNKLAEI